MEVEMKKLAMWMALMGVTIWAVVGCQPSQAGDGAGAAASGPAATGPTATVPVTEEPAATGADVSPGGSDYTEATSPGGEAGGIADVLGEGGLGIVYERSGGFAGVMERTEIYRDGRVVTSDDGQERELQVAGAQVEALLTLLEKVDFAQLDRSEPSSLDGSEPSSLGGQGADRFAYSLTIVQDGKPVRVSWTEGQSGVPAGLVDVVVAIQELIRNAD